MNTRRARRGKKRKWRLMGLTMLLLFLACCTEQSPTLQRAERAEKAKGAVLVGAAGPWSIPLGMKLWPGITLATEEINETGGVLGRRIQILKKDDKDSVTTGLGVAQSFVENKDVVAVIGHVMSYVSVPTSVLYDYNGILMLSPLSTSPELTSRGFRLVFRNIPDDTAFGKRLALFAHSQGYKHVLIYYLNNDYGQGFATNFENEAEILGINVSDRMPYEPGSSVTQFRRDISRWKLYFEFDAIMLTGVLPQTAVFIREAREMGVTCPIITGQMLDSSTFFKIVGEQIEDVFATSTFRPEWPRNQVTRFVSAFRKRYGSNPSEAAAQGYDALKLLAYAMDRAKSSSPLKMAKELHSIRNWPGVTGDTTFNQRGDVLNKPILIKRAHQGRFVLFQSAEAGATRTIGRNP